VATTLHVGGRAAAVQVSTRSYPAAWVTSAARAPGGRSGSTVVIGLVHDLVGESTPPLDFMM
jgi:hypothetical protein